MARLSFDRGARPFATREARVRNRGTVPLPPMPDDPMVCRWCESRRVKLSTGDVLCSRGCAANESAPYAGQCSICAREFETGSSDTSVCWQCSKREYRAGVADAGPRSTGYEADMRAKGANREAMRIKESER